MTLEQEPAIDDWGAILICVFGLMVEFMVGIVLITALCAQRYDKDESLNISFAHDMRRLSVAKMTDHQFHRKLIRYARYALTFQWLFYFICNILILIHEFAPEPVLIDHFIYITFILNLTFLFLTFRNIGIYYFFPFTDDKNFPNLIRRRQIEIERAQIDPKNQLLDKVEEEPDKQQQQQENNESDDDDDDDDDEEDQKQTEMKPTTRNGEIGHDNDDTAGSDDGHNHHNGHSHSIGGGGGGGGRRFSHHHYENDPDLAADPINIEKTGDKDWDSYNEEKFKIRSNFVHLFRSISYTTIIYWCGYIIAVIHGKNDVVLAGIALADMLYIVLVGCHMYLCRSLLLLIKKYEKVLDGYDTECEKRRENRLFQLDRWFKADIGVICVLFTKCIVLLIRISQAKTKFSWPSSHPVFLATTFVIIASCQMTCCRYIWLTKTD